MPKMILTAAYLSLDGNEVSASANKVELAVEVEEKDVTTYGSLGWKEVLGGLKSGSLGIEFKNDFADDALDEEMWALLGTVVPFEARASQASVGPSNPTYSGSVLVKEWKPLQGSVGDDAQVSVSYPTSGAVARATS